MKRYVHDLLTKFKDLSLKIVKTSFVPRVTVLSAGPFPDLVSIDFTNSSFRLYNLMILYSPCVQISSSFRQETPKSLAHAVFSSAIICGTSSDGQIGRTESVTGKGREKFRYSVVDDKGVKYPICSMSLSLLISLG